MFQFALKDMLLFRIKTTILALILSRDIAIMCVAGYLRVKSVLPPETLKKIFNMKNATVHLYPTLVSKVCSFYHCLY